MEKKRNKTIMAVAALCTAAVTLVACKDEMVFSNPFALTPSEEIVFQAQMGGPSAEAFTRSAGYVDIEEQEWEITGTENGNDSTTTRTDAQEDLYGYFGNAGLRIYCYDGEWSAPTAFSAAVNAATYPNVLPGIFNSSGLLTPYNFNTGEPFTILWKQAKNPSTDDYYENMRTYAFAPLVGSHGIQSLIAQGLASYSPGTIAVGAQSTAPSITYQVPDLPEEQVDLIAGYSGEVDGGLRAVVPMTFRHVLSAVQFKLGFGARVTSLTISGVYKKGTGTINDDGSLKVDEIDDADGDGTPDEVGDDLYAYTYIFNESNGGYTQYTESDGVVTKDGSTQGDNVLTSGDETLMMIPQTLPDDATVTLNYQTSSDGGNTWDNKSISCSLKGNVWKPGYRYVYTIKEEPSYDIFFDFMAGPIDIRKGTTSDGSGGDVDGDGSSDVNKHIYKGYIYVNGVSTVVTGVHQNSNHYYVYQSTGDTSESGFEVNNKDNTGYATEDDFINKRNIRIPQYSQVMAPDGSKSWADYVTNNPNSDEVIGSWADAATAVKRKPNETSYIHVDQNNNVGRLDLDLTIDNIWSTLYDRTSDNSGNIQLWGRAAGCDMTILLKGDNYFCKVRHYTRDTAQGEAKINYSSYYGDGSIKGSLTVMPPSTNFYSSDISSGVGNAISSYSGGGNIHYGLTFSGATIYAASPTYYHNDAYGWGHGCIGAGNNSHAEVNITGGRVTAVCHGTGAAIGGGAGFAATAGNGIVNISGGEVYAYQFGTASNRSSHTMCITSTAIGGGSTFGHNGNSGNVTITGGKVYAQSVGGVAIGGGSSGGSVGGQAIISISGNAEVTAKSIPGTITEHYSGAEYHVDAGTSIGGGNGGDLNRKTSGASNYPNGGTATVTISGGKILSGSVGGGKNGYYKNGAPALLGNAIITVSGDADVQAQMVMADTNPTTADDGSNKPKFTMTAGKLHLTDDENFYFTRPNGGAVWMDAGECNISGGTISDFKAADGGAIYIYRDNTASVSSITFNMTGGTIENCKAKYDGSSGSVGNGGAVYINDVKNEASVNFSGGTLSGNYADQNGGGIYLKGGNVTIEGGTITGNRTLDTSGSYGDGAGIYLNKGNFTMTDGTISGNAANHDGGGICVTSDDTDIYVEISGGTITQNVAEHFGAGLYVKPGGSSSATVNIGATGTPYSNTNPSITGNSASLRGGAIYAYGENTTLNLYDGLIKNNYVSSYVYNNDITNEGGSVNMELYPGDYATTELQCKPVPDLDYITVTIDPAGGDFSAGTTTGDPVYRYLVKSTKSSLAIPTPKRANYTFKGWLPSQGEGDTGYSLQDYIDATGGSMIFNYDKDITLTAQWELAL